MNDGAVRVVAVNGGLSEPSSTRMLIDRMVAAVTDALGDREVAVEVEVIDLRDLAVDLGRSMAVGFASGEARAALDAVESADALVVASPVFNASYSGLFKMFFDLVDVDAMAGRPVLIAATGGSPRHSMVLDHALRPLFSYLRTLVVPTGVYAA
ncbi:NAD(P)H-dependent oxidoreductase, partial [Gordonia alkanivorans]